MPKQAKSSGQPYTNGPMVFTGAYSDGMYFKGGSDDNTMYAFNATTGEIIWSYHPKPTDTSSQAAQSHIAWFMK